MLKNILFILVFITVVGCDDLFFDETPKTKPLEVYDAFVHQLNTKSPFLQYIPMDVDSLFEDHGRQIEQNPSGKQLMRSFKEILNVLQDAHTTLTYDLPNDKMFVRYNDWRTKYPENKLSDISHYFASYSVIGGERIEYGRLEKKNIGYLKLNTLSLGRLTRDIRSILESFDGTDGTDGLILDLRSTADTFYNYSSSYEERDILEMLSDSSEVYFYKRIRKSVSRNSFTEWEPVWLTLPDNSTPIYPKSIAVLINRQTTGGAELLTAGIRTNSSGIIIGDTTAGFIGNPDFTHLTGKWYMTVSMNEFKLPENYLDSSKRFEGIPPDINVEISPEDSSTGIDTILERALEELSN